MQKKIAVISGDGTGPEVTHQSIKVLDAVARQFKHTFLFEYGLIGANAIDKTGSPLPHETVALCKSSNAVLFGGTQYSEKNYLSTSRVEPEQAILKLRDELELYACIRPIIAYSSLQHLSPLKSNRIEGLDFIILQELTGCIEFGKKQLSEDNQDKIAKVAHLAFAYAQKRRKALTLVDKANMPETSELWRKVVQEISAEYADVTVDYLFADDAVMQIIINPKQFDVILTDNLFGGIISDEASVITGSPGLLPSAFVGNEFALFQSVNDCSYTPRHVPTMGRVPATDPVPTAGKNIANPNGSILSAAMMLDHFNLIEEAELVREAVQWTLANGFVTKDIDPINNYSTATIGDLVSDYVENRIPSRMNKENMVISKSTII